MVRRFFPLEMEFRAIIYTTNNRTTLIGLAANGHSLWLVDALDGTAVALLQNSSTKFTSIAMKNETTVLVGSFEGGICELSIVTGVMSNRRNVSDSPIVLLHNESTFADSNGHLFVNDKLVLDDGILQPCALLESNEIIYYIKHSSVHIYNLNTGSLESVTLSSSVFCAAELYSDNQLILCTDSNQLYILDSNDLKLKEYNTNDSIESESDSDREDEEDENVDDSRDNSDRIFSLILSPKSNNDLLLLKVNTTTKLARLETIQTSRAAVTSDTNCVVTDKVNILCPLCQDIQSQSVLLNSKVCNSGHPIAICAQSKLLINDHLETYRCRSCHLAYSSNPQSCLQCPSSLITKIQIK